MASVSCMAMKAILICDVESKHNNTNQKLRGKNLKPEIWHEVTVTVTVIERICGKWVSGWYWKNEGVSV